MEFEKAQELGKLMSDIFDSRHPVAGKGAHNWAFRAEPHSEIIKRKVKRFENLPRRENPILLCTTGPSAIANREGLDKILQEFSNGNDSTAKKLREAFGDQGGAMTPDSVAELGHDMMKEELWLNYGKEKYLTHIPAMWEDHKEDIERLIESLKEQNLSPADLSGMFHVESSWLMERIADQCIEKRLNLAYMISSVGNAKPMLERAKRAGYRLVALSVEQSLEATKTKNEENWQKGREEYVNGRSEFGRVAAPVEVIERTYPSSDEISICRENVMKLAPGLFDTLIEVTGDNVSSVKTFPTPGAGSTKPLPGKYRPASPTRPIDSDKRPTPVQPNQVHSSQFASIRQASFRPGESNAPETSPSSPPPTPASRQRSNTR
ncbi:hypothetical protein RJT17_36890 [Streptomyces sp. P5-A9]|uniref:hypothetical protein n=2 Tax=unclassified Streptomyces TaxID=2593676 RepID=UPI002FC9E7C1